MITVPQLLMNRARFEDLPTETQANLIILCARLNELEEAYGKPVKLNDGLRTPAQGYGAPSSKHRIGAAADLDDDAAADLWHWVKDNLAVLKKIGLWVEDPRWTHGPKGTWMHFQIFAPGSGRRIFVPSTAPATAPLLWDGRYDPSFN